MRNPGASCRSGSLATWTAARTGPQRLSARERARSSTFFPERWYPCAEKCRGDCPRRATARRRPAGRRGSRSAARPARPRTVPVPAVRPTATGTPDRRAAGPLAVNVNPDFLSVPAGDEVIPHANLGRHRGADPRFPSVQVSERKQTVRPPAADRRGAGRRDP